MNKFEKLTPGSLIKINCKKCLYVDIAKCTRKAIFINKNENIFIVSFERIDEYVHWYYVLTSQKQFGRMSLTNDIIQIIF